MFYCVILIFFFLILRRPPISTLFPYTTLFRSSRQNRASMPFLRRGRHTRRRSRYLRRCPSRVPTCGQDRKSTRLNSSHANISYAVFCLKKKKKITLKYYNINKQWHSTH